MVCFACNALRQNPEKLDIESMSIPDPETGLPLTCLVVREAALEAREQNQNGQIFSV